MGPSGCSELLSASLSTEFQLCTAELNLTNQLRGIPGPLLLQQEQSVVNSLPPFRTTPRLCGVVVFTVDTAFRDWLVDSIQQPHSVLLLQQGLLLLDFCSAF